MNASPFGIVITGSVPGEDVSSIRVDLDKVKMEVVIFQIFNANSK